MRYTYCVFCLSWGMSASARYQLSNPLTPRATTLLADMALPGAALKTGRVSYVKIEHGMIFPGMTAFVEFVEMFGTEFMYTDTDGRPFNPIAVTTVNGDSVCLEHIPSNMDWVKLRKMVGK